jgi:hypothetical protein
VRVDASFEVERDHLKGGSRGGIVDEREKSSDERNKETLFESDKEGQNEDVG